MQGPWGVIPGGFAPLMKGDITMKKETPCNIEELKRKANNQSNWRERLYAVQVLRKYDCQQSRDILTRLAIHDKVFTVKEAAFRAAQAMKITKNGKPIYLSKKPKGDLVKGIHKKLAHVKSSLPEGYTLEEFRNEFKRQYPDVYDVYEGDKGKLFDKWLRNVASIPPQDEL